MPARKDFTHKELYEMKALYENGTPLRAIGVKLGCNAATVQYRAKKYGWLKPKPQPKPQPTGPAGEVNPETGEVEKYYSELLGRERSFNDTMVTDAVLNRHLEKEPDSRAKLIVRHRMEWDDHSVIVQKAIMQEDEKLARISKITAETLKLRQDQERIAWGIDDPNAHKAGPSVYVNQQFNSDGEVTGKVMDMDNLDTSDELRQVRQLIDKTISQRRQKQNDE